MSLNPGYIKTVGGMLKLVEIVFVLVAFGILRSTTGDGFITLPLNALYFGIGSTVTCMIITPLLLIIYLMGNLEVQQTIMETVLNFVLSVLLLTFGGLSMDYFTDLPAIIDKAVIDKGIAMSSFALLAGITYMADSVVAAIKYKR